jgi:parallel beta-helix repeat protein
MRSKTWAGSTGLALAVGAALLSPASAVGRAEPATHTLTCGAGRSIASALTAMKPGDTLRVSGVCHENVVVGEEFAAITLDGQGEAAIDAAPGENAVTITGRGITIRGFVITGGAQGIAVVDGGSAVIDGNTVQNTEMIGITVFRDSTAEIINNTVRNNPGAGIALQSNGSARIGFVGPPSARISAPNTIENNGHGIRVYRDSSAQIYSNTIRNNASHGVFVDRNSHADVGANVITGNGGDGIHGMRNAGLDLGTDVNNATPQFDDDTNTGTNTGFAVRCMIGGFADGRLGALAGAAGAKSFSEGCVDSVTP